jgi:hypothetical protein
VLTANAKAIIKTINQLDNFFMSHPSLIDYKASPVPFVDREDLVGLRKLVTRDVTPPTRGSEMVSEARVLQSACL